MFRIIKGEKLNLRGIYNLKSNKQIIEECEKFNNRFRINKTIKEILRYKGALQWLDKSIKRLAELGIMFARFVRK